MRLLSSRPTILAAAAISLCIPFLAACGSRDTGDAEAPSDAGCVTDYQSGVDYFPDKIDLEDAQGFDVEYHDHYQVLTVNEPYQGAKPELYVLVRCGTPEPELTGALAQAAQITVPVANLYSGSTTHLASLELLDQLSTLQGVSDGSYVSSEAVVDLVEAGKLTEYAKGGSVDVEAVVGGDPDVLVTGGTESPEYAKLRTAGVPVVANSEWLESTPLGRAEWIKFFGALTGTETRAEAEYDKIKARYTEVAEQAADVDPVPVLPGAAYQGNWSMASGRSYVGRLIADAGGTYPWADTRATGSLSLDLEAIVGKAGDIETWLINDQTVSTLDDLLAQDDRYAELAASKADQVWNATNKIGPNGGNDYWESGVQRPDLVLSDLVKILHPGLLPDPELVYYKQIPRG